MAKHYTSRAERKRITRRALIESAAELLSENGLRGTTLEAVAERAGLHVQTLYRHFANKSELFAALEDSILEDQKTELEDPTRRLSTLQTRYRMDVERLVQMQEAGVRTALNSLLDPENAGVHMLTSHRYEDLLSEHFAKELGLRANDPEPRLLAAMVQWGSFSVLRGMDDATANSEKATHDLYRRTFKLIQKVYDLFAESTQASKKRSK